MAIFDMPLVTEVLPAHAGVILGNPNDGVKLFSFTRTRGGDPEKGRLQQMGVEFYPHTRG